MYGLVGHAMRLHGFGRMGVWARLRCCLDGLGWLVVGFGFYVCVGGVKGVVIASFPQVKPYRLCIPPERRNKNAGAALCRLGLSL